MYHKLLLLLLLLFFFPRSLWQAGNYPRSGGKKRNTHTRFSRVAVCFWNSDVDHKYLAKDRSQWSVIIQFWSIQAVNYEHHGRLFHFLGAFQKVPRGINTPIKDCFWTACDSGLSLKYIETINYLALSKKGPLKVRTIGSISILLLIVGVYDFHWKTCVPIFFYHAIDFHCFCNAVCICLITIYLIIFLCWVLIDYQ